VQEADRDTAAYVLGGTVLLGVGGAGVGLTGTDTGAGGTSPSVRVIVNLWSLFLVKKVILFGRISALQVRLRIISLKKVSGKAAGTARADGRVTELAHGGLLIFWVVVVPLDHFTDCWLPSWNLYHPLEVCTSSNALKAVDLGVSACVHM
jgi:hypothetical protein